MKFIAIDLEIEQPFTNQQTPDYLDKEQTDFH